MTAPIVPEPDEATRRQREERDVAVARTLDEVRALVDTLRDVTSDLAAKIDNLIEDHD